MLPEVFEAAVVSVGPGSSDPHGPHLGSATMAGARSAMDGEDAGSHPNSEEQQRCEEAFPSFHLMSSSCAVATF